jgi:uncharacterized membrane protein required for colicin V production
MTIHFLVLHVTLLLIVAFFILFAASRADGLLKLFGSVLGVWVVIVAVLHIVAFCMPGMMGMKGVHDGMHGQWMHHWGSEAPTAAPAPAVAPAPAMPAPKKP